ncbi:DUF1559 domain-containing protein [Coraliomargarita algicola]|uniref:DUF1559 domain-containing protein n=1 Tax=Coraliomargarita algicola TaxID=3092156 RepID=A0ABZ0RMZ6_9BACT|nr:DUF1559 domain-containing protein [Coraliomargarita sp. J2-16]WPJ96594.1 DUF1559 domain-containing protein [Coraliomargarita sp. J2-16]
MTSYSFKYPRIKQQRVAAFTLIELLTVIAIVGILAAIIIPSVGKVREASQVAKCVTHLRQLALGATAYASDHNGNFVSLYSGGGDDPTLTWVDQIAPYVGGEGQNRIYEVVNCPSADYIMEFDGVRKSTYSYGWNPALVPDARDLDGDGIRASPIRSITMQRPNETMLIADTIQKDSRKGWGNDYFVSVGSKVYTPSTADDYISESSLTGFSDRHNGRGNVAFVDGHVESFAVGEIKQKHVYVE